MYVSNVHTANAVNIVLTNTTKPAFVPRNKVSNFTALAHIECKQVGEFTKHNISSAHVVFVIDVSSSMGKNLDAIREAVLKLIDRLDGSCQVSIISFSHEVRKLTSTPVTMNAIGRTKIRGILDSLTAYGSTDIIGAVVAAANYIISYSELSTQMLLLTDGHQSVGCLDFHAAIAAADTCYDHSRFTLRAFAIGNEPDGRCLRKLCRMTPSGQFEYVKSISTMFDGTTSKLLSMVHDDYWLDLDAQPGARITGIVDRTYEETIPGKKYRIFLGSMHVGDEVSVMYNVSVRGIDGDDHHLLNATLMVGGSVIESALILNRGDPTAVQSPEAAGLFIDAETRLLVATTANDAITSAENGSFAGAIASIESVLKFIMTLPRRPAVVASARNLRDLRNVLDVGVYHDERNAAYSIMSQYDQNTLYCVPSL